jgi:hypothetical protein
MSARDALLLAARELARRSLRLDRKPDALGLLADAAPHLVLRSLPPTKAESNVLRNAQVGEKRIALKDRVRRPLERWDTLDVGTVDQDPARGRLLEAGDHPERGGLSAAAGAEQREELPSPDRERQLPHGSEVTEALGHALEVNARPLCAVLLVHLGEENLQPLPGRLTIQPCDCSVTVISLSIEASLLRQAPGEEP